MTGNEMFLLKRGCGALELEDIVKDIQEKKDNAMSMEFTKSIGELLIKNGVKVKMTEYTGNFENGNTFETRYGVTIDDLDFTEHDKPFNDKISELKAKIAIKDNDYKTISGLLGSYQQENESLKQRIAELESKESEKTMRIEFHADNGEMLTPLEVANSLINQNTFKVNELRELSEFLQVYCNHHEDRDTEPSIMLF